MTLDDILKFSKDHNLILKLDKIDNDGINVRSYDGYIATLIVSDEDNLCAHVFSRDKDIFNNISIYLKLYDYSIEERHNTPIDKVGQLLYKRFFDSMYNQSTNEAPDIIEISITDYGKKLLDKHNVHKPPIE